MISHCLFWLALSSAAVAAPTTPWSQEIYVWQRQGGPALAAALESSRTLAGGYQVLVAEVTWGDGHPRIFRAAPDYRKLVETGRPVGLVLRVGAYGGPFAVVDPAAQTLTTLVATLLAESRGRGLEPAELQVDFDCAESKLAGYGRWLAALRGVTGKTPLIFTALPAWLRQPEFATLAGAADGFVLQVHSLEKPAGPEAPFTLCDPVRARASVEQAGRVGVPFRVALPTYGYLLAFDATGKFFALAAEGARPAWPADTQVREIRADPVAMARLAGELAAARPPHCGGVIWFRLPVAGDRLNWDWLTLATVMRGEIPVARLEVTVGWAEPGLAEVIVGNTGQTTEPLPPGVLLSWPEDARLLAADGLNGFRLETSGASSHASVVAGKKSPDALLAPGHRTKIAWLRFAHEVPVDASLPSARP